MGNKYQSRFNELKNKGQKAFIPFTLLGWPNVEASKEIIEGMIDAGVTALELGFPFSDPVSDGPVIQTAASEAIKNGFTVDDGFKLLRDIRHDHPDIPIGLLVYYNLILARGVEAFFIDCKTAAIDGVLIPDLPPEMTEEVLHAATANDVELIFIVSPLSMKRLDKILRHAGGFLYIVSRLGITGTDEHYDNDLQQLIQHVKTQSDLPCCVGFGISTSEHAKQMLKLGADGVITGSRIIQIVSESPNYKKDVWAFLKEMVLATSA